VNYHRHVAHSIHETQTQSQTQTQQQEWSPLQSNPATPLATLQPHQQIPPPVPPLPPAPFSKQDESIYGNQRKTVDSTTASTLHHYPVESKSAYPASTRGGGAGGAFGPGPRIVLILSVLCGILGVAVIGLAAGTGVLAGKYADSNTKLVSMSSSYSAMAMTATSSSASASASPTSFSEITNGCSDKPTEVTGKKYTSQFKGLPVFTMFCNRDTKHDPLTSVFVDDFSLCMESCASWNRYNSGKKCKAVTFVPSWRNYSMALGYDAPGDCYLKPGPQTRNSMNPQRDTELHSALLLDEENKDDEPSETPQSKAPKQTESAKLR
jgi:hypothetical protein